MFYLPLLIVCSLAPGFVGDTDTGATCIKFSDAVETKYYTLADCERRIREIQESVLADVEKLNGLIPGPWHFKGNCVAPIIDEKADA